MLAQLTPPDMSQFEAAQVLFEADAVQKAALFTDLSGGGEFNEDQQKWLVMRGERALSRFKQMLGSGWNVGRKKPINRDQLIELAEDVLDAVLNQQQAALQGSQREQASSAQRPSNLGDAMGAQFSNASPNQQLKPAEGISADRRAAAVQPGTAEALHAADARITQATGSGRALLDVTALIGESSESLRAELRRALISNGAVDNQGETKLERRALPPSVAKASRMLLTEVALQLEAVLRADRTGRLSMRFSAAEELARKTCESKGLALT